MKQTKNTPRKYDNQRLGTTTSRKKINDLIEKSKEADDLKVKNGTHQWVNTLRGLKLIKKPLNK